ncbi:MAG: lytic transglycosylase domain-containing protein [Candidatus Marinimicrobia bacterium]|nr:lytic transglycosylase domain-containing protein [Candidatus Neomarinimicrobiota bacterium]
MITTKGGGKMYNPLSSCSAAIHLLIKHPILVIGLGLATTVSFLGLGAEEMTPQLVQKIERSSVFRAKIKELEAHPDIFELTQKSVEEKWFTAIKKVESGDKRIGVHPDGVSYGPAGLTKNAWKDVIGKIPCCKDLGYDEILNEAELSTSFAYIYFLELIHVFRDIETAVIAYNNGPTQVKKWQKANRPLPKGYLNKVKSHLGKN